MAPAVPFWSPQAAFFWASFVVVALRAPAVHPQPQRVQLTYVRDEGAESCPDEAWLKQQISSHLGYDPFIAGHPAAESAGRQISCRLSKAPSAEEFVATLQTADPNGATLGRRQLRSGPTCEALAASVVLSLSMAIDPIAAESARPPVDTVTPVAPAPPATAVQQRPVAPLRLRLSGAGVVATGWQDAAASPLASVALHLQKGAWSASLEARVSASCSTREPSLQTRLVLGGLGLCRAWGPLDVCGAAVAGPMFATSSEFEQQRNVATLVAVGPRLVWSHTLAGPLTVEAAMEAYANVVRPRVLVNDVVTWRAAAASAAVTLGFGWRLR